MLVYQRVYSGISWTVFLNGLGSFQTTAAWRIIVAGNPVCRGMGGSKDDIISGWYMEIIWNNMGYINIYMGIIWNNIWLVVCQPTPLKNMME